MTHNGNALTAYSRDIYGYLMMGLQHVTPPNDLEAIRAGAALAARAQLLYNAQEFIRVAEVGSWVGESLAAIRAGIAHTVRLIPHNVLHGPVQVNLMAVDTFQGNPSDHTSAIAHRYGRHVLDLWHHNTCQLMEDHPDQPSGLVEYDIHIYTAASVDVATSLLSDEDGAVPLDLVFIDAEHTAEAVTQDIHAWWPLLRPGGYLMGHDYCDVFPGLVQAVDQAAQELAQTCPMVIYNSSVWMFHKAPEGL